MNFHNGTKLGETHMSQNRWMDKEFVMYFYNGTLSINKRNQSPNACCNIIESQKFYASWKDSYPKSIDAYCILSFL